MNDLQTTCHSEHVNFLPPAPPAFANSIHSVLTLALRMPMYCIGYDFRRFRQRPTQNNGSISAIYRGCIYFCDLRMSKTCRKRRSRASVSCTCESSHDHIRRYALAEYVARSATRRFKEPSRSSRFLVIFLYSVHAVAVRFSEARKRI